MINDWLAEIFPLIVLCLLFVIVLLVITFWSRHYSRSAKALNLRLGDIVHMRSSMNDTPLLKDSEAVETRALPGASIAIVTRINESIKLMLLRADVEITPFKLISISFALVIASLTLIILLVQLNILILMLSVLFFGALPLIYILRLQIKRSEKIEKQLPEALDFICRSLRAGHGLTVSFGIVGDELQQPIAKEFKTVFEEINFGLPFNEALTNFAVRTNSNDINFLVVGLLIQREAGGNLIELLENLAKTIRDRMILRGKIRVLASEGKYSGILLSALPFFLGGILTVLNPQYMAPLWGSDLGQKLVMTGVIMIMIGGFWMWSISRIKV